MLASNSSETKRPYTLLLVAMVVFVIVMYERFGAKQGVNDFSSHGRQQFVQAVQDVVHQNVSEVIGSTLLQANGGAVRTAGANVRVLPTWISGMNDNVVVHSRSGVTTAGGVVSERAVRFASFMSSTKPTKVGAQIFSDKDGNVVRSINSHVSEDFDVSMDAADPTVNEIISFVQQNQISLTQETMRIPIEDVLAGCELQVEGRSRFSIRVLNTVNGLPVYEYETVEIQAMHGCDSPDLNASIYAEFVDTSAPHRAFSIVTCPNRYLDSVCTVHTGISTLDVVRVFHRLRDVVGNVPIGLVGNGTTNGTGPVLSLAEGVSMSIHVEKDIGVAGIVLTIINFVVGCAVGAMRTAVSGGSGGAIALGCLGGGLETTPIGGVAVPVVQAASGGCYPRNSLVTTPSGDVRMSSIMTGDKVLSYDMSTQTTAWTTVYMRGHADGVAISEYYTLCTPWKLLSVTEMHFVPVIVKSMVCECTKTCENLETNRILMKEFPKWCVMMKRAKNVAIGDWLLTVSGSMTNGIRNSAEAQKIISVEVELMRGLFNPYTMSGIIVVNGVVGSVHSEWLLESIGFDFPFSVDRHVPQLYQLILSPLRFVYERCPKCVKDLDGDYPRGLHGISTLEIGTKTLGCAFDDGLSSFLVH